MGSLNTAASASLDCILGFSGIESPADLNGVLYFRILYPATIIMGVLVYYGMKHYVVTLQIHRVREYLINNKSLHFVVSSFFFLTYFDVVNGIFDVYGCTLDSHSQSSDAEKKKTYYLNAHPWYQCRPATSPYKQVLGFSVGYGLLWLLLTWKIYDFIRRGRATADE